ncbi:MAG: transcription antitermination factor NusB [Chlamydiota bacterium]
MSLPPQKFREIVLQVLYSRDFSTDEEDEMIPFMMNELKVTKRVMLDVHLRVAAAILKLPEIDLLIQSQSTEYTFERISRVERTILRLGLFEILFDPEVPPKVAIAEAIRLCRKFGTPESADFVNAVLDGIYKKNETTSLLPLSQ